MQSLLKAGLIILIAWHAVGGCQEKFFFRRIFLDLTELEDYFLFPLFFPGLLTCASSDVHEPGECSQRYGKKRHRNPCLVECHLFYGLIALSALHVVQVYN